MDSQLEVGIGGYRMAELSSKRLVRRRVVALGGVSVGVAAFPLSAERRLATGDALALAMITGGDHP